MDGFGWWIVEQVRDVQCALLVFEDGALAVEGEFPKAEAAF